MANRKLTDLPELTSIADDDLIYGVDISDTSESAQGTSKKAKQSTLKTFFKTYFDTIYASISSLSAYAPINNPTFTGNVVVPDATSDNEAVNLGQLNTVDENAVHKTGNETIAGVKTFEKSIKINSLEPLDAKYLNGTVAYASLAEANALIPIGIRSPYLTIVVQGAEYWWADGAWGIKKDTYISVTKAELDTLIANNGLETGFPYKITGVHPSLYGGTTIYSKAIDRNKIEINAIGMFYTPKYDAGAGSGIWTGYVECGVSSIVGLFDVNELVTANNGATGQLFGNVNGGFITPISGTWASATSITGNASGATAVISSVSVPLTYAIGDTTIWGGYHWTNLTGALGSKVDDLNLDSTNWSKIAFNSTDYNISYDEITYDYENDFISGRKDALRNDVSFSFEDFNNVGQHSIIFFMWGNNSRVKSNIMNGAFVNVLNFRGSAILTTTFGQNSYINTTTFGQGSAILTTTFEQGSGISYVTFGQGSGIRYVTFGQGSNINTTELPTTKLIQNTTLEQSSSIASVSLTSAIEIFATYPKTVFRNSAGVSKIRYYNNNNVLVIADITD